MDILKWFPPSSDVKLRYMLENGCKIFHATSNHMGEKIAKTIELGLVNYSKKIFNHSALKHYDSTAL